MISNTHKPTMEIVAAMLNCKLHRNSRESEETRRTIWSIHVTGKKAQDAIRDISPYLITKKRQARVAMRWQFGRGLRPLRRERIVSVLSKLKKIEYDR